MLNGMATITAAATQNLCRFNLDLRGLTSTASRSTARAATFTRDGRELIITPADAAASPRHGFTVEVVYHGEPGPAPRRPGRLHRRLELHRERLLHVDPAAGRRHLVPVQQQHQRQGDLYVQCDGPSGSPGHVQRPADLQHGRRGGGHLDLGLGGDRADGDLPGDAATSASSRSCATRPRPASRSSTASARTSSPTRRGPGWPTSARSSTSSARKFGKYPFSSVGAIVDVTNAGYQMETQTRPEFTCANGLSALAHELAHQWFGDHVAVRRMRDVWLSEGFATFANWLWVGEHRRHDRAGGVQHAVRARGQHDLLEQHRLRPGRRRTSTRARRSTSAAG